MAHPITCQTPVRGVRARGPEVQLAQPTWIRLLKLAWPVIGLNVLNVLALVVDTAMVGRMQASDAALTGLGYAVQLLFLFMVAMIGLTVGNVAFVARAHGAQNAERVNHILYQSSVLTAGLGLLVAVVGNVLAHPLLWMLGADDLSAFYALEYLRPMLVFVSFNYLNILYGSTLRGVGNTRLPFAIALASNAVNVVINYGLILGNLGLPALGLQGAAIGTITSHIFAVTLLLTLLRRGWQPGVMPNFIPRAIDWTLARDLFRVGAPAALDMVVLNAGFLSIVGMLGRIDQAAVAAHGIGLRIQALAFVPGMSVSQATGAMVGNALGAGDVAEARRVFWSGMGLCAAIMTVLAFLIIGMADQIVGVFDVDPQSPMGLFAVEWMTLLGWCMPVVGIWIAHVGLFNGAGDTRTTLRINTMATLLLQIPMSALLGFGLGWSAWGVWAAFPLSFTVKAVFGALAYRRGTWAQVGERV